MNCGQIKPDRSAAPIVWRSTINPESFRGQLLRIEQLLGKNAVYAGLTALKKSK